MSERKISKVGRQRMAIAGAQNLARWKAGAPARESALQAQIDAYRERLLLDAGENLSAFQLGLVETATSTYASIIIVRTKLVHSRKADVVVLTERVSWLGSNLLRCLKALKALDLNVTKRPTCLADIDARNTAEERLKQARKALDLKESARKQSESGSKAL